MKELPDAAPELVGQFVTLRPLRVADAASPTPGGSAIAPVI